MCCNLERAYARMVAADAGKYDIPYEKIEMPIVAKRGKIRENPMECMTMLGSAGWLWVNKTAPVMREMTNEQAGSVQATRCVRSKSAPCNLVVTSNAHQAQEQCPICCEYVDSHDLHSNETNAGPYMSACHCHACAKCIVKWVNMQLPVCRANKSLRVQCHSCHKTMPQKLVLMSNSALELATALERREVLQRNELFPACMQVECRNIECVGIGYLGHETIMCMICEEQWNASEETVVHIGANEIDASELAKLGNGQLANIKVADQLTITVRKCPNCGVITEKNGGCDHMRCRQCNHEYYWSTGKKYR